MALQTTLIVGFIISMIYILYGVTTILDRSTRTKGSNIIICLLVCCLLHVNVCVMSYYFDEYRINNTLQYILCLAYPVTGYIELFLYILYYESTCGASKKIQKDIRKFNYITLALNLICTFALLPFGLIFKISADGEYIRGPLFAITYVFVFLALIILIVFTIIIRPTPRKTFAYISYSIMPVLSSIIMVVVGGNSLITDASTMLSFVVLFSFVYMSERHGNIKKEMKLAEYRTDIMMSQIRPHFIYNTLSTIAALCTIDPEGAQNLTVNFSDYLRTNLNLAKMQKLIPFSEELKHTQQYVGIEKVRFGERINVEYDIKESDFLVPSLSIQPIVENAIKHGILKKEDGGTVWISTEKVKNEYVITIKDNGIGFDSDNMVPEEGHYGTATTKERLKLLLNGDLEINSSPNVGTVVKMYTGNKEEAK